MCDEEIIELYFCRSPQAIEVTKKQYERLCIRLSMNILNNIEDAEECFNDSLLKMWQTIPPRRPVSLKAYLCKIVKNLSLKKYEYNSARKRNSEYEKSLDELKECISRECSVESTVESKELNVAVNCFLNTLPDDKRIMFVKRYYLLEPVKDIASDFSISEKNASARLSRIRIQLKNYLTKEGYIYG